MKTMEYNKINYEPKDYTASTVTNVTHNTQRDFNSLVEKYMLLDKKTLAELLALKEFQKDNTYSTYPYVSPQGPWVTYCTHCTNPFHDCINCPYCTTNIKFTTTSTTANEQ